MTTEQIIDNLWELLEGGVGGGTELTDELRGIQHFSEAGLLTSDQGLVLVMEDGTKVYLTVQQR